MMNLEPGGQGVEDSGDLDADISIDITDDFSVDASCPCCGSISEYGDGELCYRCRYCSDCFAWVIPSGPGSSLCNGPEDYKHQPYYCPIKRELASGLWGLEEQDDQTIALSL